MLSFRKLCQWLFSAYVNQDLRRRAEQFLWSFCMQMNVPNVVWITQYKSAAPILPVAESNFCMKIFWGSYWLTEHSEATATHTAHSTLRKHSGGAGWWVRSLLHRDLQPVSCSYLKDLDFSHLSTDFGEPPTLLHWVLRGQWKVPCKFLSLPHKSGSPRF